MEELKIDLLRPRGADEDSPVGTATRLAAEKFADQLKKARLSLSRIRSAHLSLRRALVPVQGAVNGLTCFGYAVDFSIEVLTERGSRYEQEINVFVAPHNPATERRSAGAV